MNEKQIVSQELKIIDRNQLYLNGVEKIISFDSNEFILESAYGPVHISGENLELLNLNDMNIRIKGKITTFCYIEKLNKKNKESFISKLFK